MDELESHWKVENAAWHAALSLINTNGDLIEEFDVALKKFKKRKSCSKASKEYCAAKLKDAINVASHSIKFMRSRIGTLPPKPVRRYELLLDLAKELEAKFPDANRSLHMTGCRYVELHWDR